MESKVYKRLCQWKYTDADAMEQYFEDMALKGWKLKNVNMFMNFEKIEPQKIRYHMEMFTRLDMGTQKPEQEIQTYILYCKRQGWEYVCNIGKMFVFITTDQNVEKLPVKNKYKYETISNITASQNRFSWIFLPLFIYMFYASFVKGTIENTVAGYMGLFFMSVILLIFISFFIKLVGFMIWDISNKLRIDSEKKIKMTTYKSYKNRCIYNSIPAMTLGLVCIIMAIIQATKNDNHSTLSLIALSLTYFYIAAIKISIDKINIMQISKLIIPMVLACFVIINVFIVMFISVFNTQIVEYTVIDDGENRMMVYEQKLPIMLDDLIEESGTYENSYMSSDHTFLASWESAEDTGFDKIKGDEQKLNYDIFISDFNALCNLYVNQKKHLCDYTKLSNSKWNVDKIYKCYDEDEETTSLLIQDNNKVVCFNANIKLDNEQIDTLINKLLKDK